MKSALSGRQWIYQQNRAGRSYAKSRRGTRAGGDPGADFVDPKVNLEYFLLFRR